MVFNEKIIKITAHANGGPHSCVARSALRSLAPPLANILPPMSATSPIGTFMGIDDRQMDDETKGVGKNLTGGRTNKQTDGHTEDEYMQN
jgi:hypothetical protein